MFRKKMAFLLAVSGLAVFAATGSLTTHTNANARGLAVPAPTVEGAAEAKKGFAGYRGIMIGVTADEVRTKLGAPKDKGDEQDMYIFSDAETAQFFYDATHTVSGIMVTYTGTPKESLKPVDLFGEDAPPKPDGGIFKMERYPKAGYWISYNKSPGSDSVVSIAVQKIPH